MGVLRVVALLLLAVALYGCSAERGLETALGGATTRDDASRNSFGLPAPGLSNEERRVFEIGDSFFTQNWVTAPASTDARDGLGPTFNARACSSCHVLDGRGAPPDPTGETANLGLLFRLSVPGRDALTGAPLPEPTYGGQLQDRAVLGVEAEGVMSITYETVVGRYGDGTHYELRSPTYAIDDLAFGPLAADVRIGPRLAPQLIGMGLLEAIAAADIEKLSDPNDSDGDGISGRVNTVWNVRTQARDLGRFGWKANVATVEQQVAGAFNGDIGITSALHPDQNCGSDPVCTAQVNGGTPELTDSRLASTTFYQRTLSVPALRDGADAAVQQGSELFDSFNCSSCHVRQHTTAASDVETLAHQVIIPFTDLLLHDMGAGLADGRADFEASGTEWRTSPLWGLGLIDDVNGQRFLLHDGRAQTIEEAILWHGGEAEAGKEQFRLAPADQRAAIVAFLEAL